MSIKDIASKITDSLTEDMFNSEPKALVQKTKHHLDDSHLKPDWIKVHKLDTKRCRPWVLHDRMAKWFTPRGCEDLINSILRNGQQEPGLVRRLKDDPNFDYEIICGARRHYACSHIFGKPFLARITEADDQKCAVLMHVENADRKDISPYERAVSFYNLLNAGVFKTQNEIAATLGLSKAMVSQMMLGAELSDYPWISSIVKDTSKLPLKAAIRIRTAIGDDEAKARGRCDDVAALKIGERRAIELFCQATPRKEAEAVRYNKKGNLLTISVNMACSGFSVESLMLDIEGYIRCSPR